MLWLSGDILSCRFVSMESEEDAKDTLIDLRLKKRLFRGQPVKGRLKSEAVPKTSSYFPPQSPVMGMAPMMFSPSMPFVFGSPMAMQMDPFGYGAMAESLAAGSAAGVVGADGQLRPRNVVTSSALGGVDSPPFTSSKVAASGGLKDISKDKKVRFWIFAENHACIRTY
jgi:hypothetical protein